MSATATGKANIVSGQGKPKDTFNKLACMLSKLPNSGWDLTYDLLLAEQIRSALNHRTRLPIHFCGYTLTVDGDGVDSR